MYTSFDIFFEPSVIRINVVYSCTLIYFKSRRSTLKATIQIFSVRVTQKETKSRTTPSVYFMYLIKYRRRLKNAVHVPTKPSIRSSCKCQNRIERHQQISRRKSKDNELVQVPKLYHIRLSPMLCLGRHEESPEDDRQKMIVAATAATGHDNQSSFA